MSGGRKKGPGPFKIIKGGKTAKPSQAPQPTYPYAPEIDVWEETEVLVKGGFEQPPQVARVFSKNGVPMFTGFGWPPRPPR